MILTRAAKRALILEDLRTGREMFEECYVVALSDLDAYAKLPDEEIIEYSEKGWQITIKKIPKKEPKIIMVLNVYIHE